MRGQVLKVRIGRQFRLAIGRAGPCLLFLPPRTPSTDLLLSRTESTLSRTSLEPNVDMSLQQQYQPFSGAPSSSGQAYPYPQHQQQQHPQPPQPQPIQHRQPPPAQQQPSQMDPSTYASAAYYQPPPQVAQASRKPSGVGGAGDDGEGGQMESGSSAAGSKESDGNSFEVRRLSFHECGRSWHRWDGRGARSEPHWKEADLVSSTAAGFQFTKRKKWAQLLIDELHDSVIVVCLPLSNGGQRVRLGAFPLRSWMDRRLIDSLAPTDLVRLARRQGTHRVFV